MVGPNRSERRGIKGREKKKVESNGRPVVNAPFHGAILSGERLNAPRGKYLLSPWGRKLDYLCFHKDHQTAYMTKCALAVG